MKLLAVPAHISTRLRLSGEVVVADNGSTDGSRELATEGDSVFWCR